MIYKFKSKADADLIMLATSGDQLLRIIGKEPSSQGIIDVKALPAAMAALEAAIAHDEKQHEEHGKEYTESTPAEDGPRVRLHQRLWPMLEMMKRALAEHADIVWGV